jgi:two-component system, CAI-1 autoinducer sensor kinase/phosphatase CqsS
MRNSKLAWLRKEIFDPDIETVLHPSPLRFKVLGLFTLLGQLTFLLTWGVLVPQPYENIYVRLGMATLGIGMFFEADINNNRPHWKHKYSFMVFWLQLPIFFTWMYWMNNGNAVWLASMAAMLLIYYHFTDWRLATMGVLTGVPLATAFVYWQLGNLIELPAAHCIVIFFSFLAAIALGASNANLRRERLRQSLVLIGIMAHELRTPLATASLIGQAIVAETTNHDEKSRTQGLNKLAKRLEALTLAINHHIDLQMMNARFMQLPHTMQLVSATGLVNKVVTQYPFSSKKEENCIEVVVHQDFMFFGSERQFIQVLNNLLKNALYSLKAAQSRFTVGDLRIELGVNAGLGRFSVADKGMGIGQEHLARVFEPFFSTNQDTGHGLGLAYCKQVVQKSGGVIGVRSEFAKGTFFTIDLPVQPLTTGGPSHHALSSLPSP